MSDKNFLSALARKRIGQFLTHFTLIVITIFALFPILTTLLISFKEQADITRNPPVIFPCDTETDDFDPSACRWVVQGYERVLAPKPSETSITGIELTGNMVRTYLPNTILYATVASLFVVFLAGTSGYAFSRFKFKGRKALMSGILAITGVPLLTNVLALYQMGVKLRHSPFPFDDRYFIIFVYVGFFLPLSVWIAKGFFDAIPKELEEAALIDGCSPFGALMRVVMPLAAPGLGAVFLLTFVNVWNEFIAGYLLITKNENKTAMFGIYDFISVNLINLQVVAAVCILIALPIVVLFLFTRRTFLKAMVEGAVKG